MVSQAILIGIAAGVFFAGLGIFHESVFAEHDSEFEINDPLYIGTFGANKFPVQVSNETFFVYYDYTKPSDSVDKIINITEMSINEEKKSLVIDIEEVPYRSHIAFVFPDKMIDAQNHDFKLFVDGEEKNYELTHFSTHTALDLMISQGVKEIEIVGTYVIPEFGQIAALILIVGIISAIIVTRKQINLQSTTRF